MLRPRGAGCCYSKPEGDRFQTLAPSESILDNAFDWARPFEDVGSAFKSLPEQQQALVLNHLRKLTDEQARAAATAASFITEVAAAMDAVPEAQKVPAMHENGSSAWDFLNGALIEQLLSHTPLIDIEYLVHLVDYGGVMPAGRQHVPPAAFITLHNVWRLKLWNKERNKGSLAVLAFSYPWLDWWAPDRVGEQLRRVLPILKAMMAEAKSDSQLATVGVMIDFLCLPQRPYTDERDKQRFGVSLKSINQWYYHKNATTLLITNPPPPGALYTNTRLHRQRGWCFFEKAASMAIKRGYCLLDVAKYAGATKFCGKYVVDQGGCIGQMKAGRQPPLSPDAFAQQMQSGVVSGELKFTANADMEFVIGQYKQGFVASINIVASRPDRSARILDFTHLKWRDTEAATLLDALRYAAVSCEFPRGPVCVFCADGNRISNAMLQTMPPRGDYYASDESPPKEVVDYGAPGDSRHEWSGKFYISRMTGTWLCDELPE